VLGSLLCEARNKIIFTEKVNGIERLIYLLRTSHEKIREACAWCIRYLVHGCALEQVTRSCAGAIPFLVKMLSFSTSDTAKEAAIWAICSLACDITLCMLIIDAGALGPLFTLLKTGTESCKEAAAWTFQNIGPTELRKEGYTLPLLREAGISLSVLAAQRRIDGINICTMAMDGFTFHELQEGGFDIFGFLHSSASLSSISALRSMKDVEDFLEAILLLSQLPSNMEEMLLPQHQLLQTLYLLIQLHGIRDSLSVPSSASSTHPQGLVQLTLKIYLQILRYDLHSPSVRESIDMGYIDLFKYLLTPPLRQEDECIPFSSPLPSSSRGRKFSQSEQVLILEIFCELSVKPCYKELIMGNQSIVSDLLHLLSHSVRNIEQSCFNNNTASPAMILLTLSVLCQDAAMDLKKGLGKDPKLCQSIVKLLKHCKIPHPTAGRGGGGGGSISHSKYFLEYDQLPRLTRGEGGTSPCCPLLTSCRLMHLIVCDTVSRDLYGTQYDTIPLLLPMLSTQLLQYSEAALKALRSLVWYHNQNQTSLVDGTNGLAILHPLLHRGYDQIKIELLWILNNLITSYSHLLLSNTHLLDTLFNLIHYAENKECQEVAMVTLNSLIQQSPEAVVTIFPALSLGYSSSSALEITGSSSVLSSLSPSSSGLSYSLDPQEEPQSQEQLLSSQRIHSIVTIFRNGTSNNSKLSAACCLNYLIVSNECMREILERDYHLSRQTIQTKILC
jgi:hypothetical protein